jgi:hypothetical protein
MTATKERFGAGFYQNYFQEPGVAEASLGENVATSLRLTYAGVRSPEPSGGSSACSLSPNHARPGSRT